MENTAPATRSTSTRTASRSTQLGTEVELEMAQAERQDIDIFLEDTAERNNLTVANVKSILKVNNKRIKSTCEHSYEEFRSIYCDKLVKYFDHDIFHGIVRPRFVLSMCL